MTMTSMPAVMRPDAQQIDSAADAYERYGLVALPQVVDPAWISARMRELHDALAESIDRRRLDHPVGDGFFGKGYTFGRLDPTHEVAGERITAAFDEFGISSWAGQVAVESSAWLGDITGYDLTFDRCFVLVYDEFDYISAHGDKYDGHRINLQFPFTYDTVTCMRVLQDGLLVTQYDEPGSPRVLGPRMWHEVPPVLRLSPESDPLRLVLSLRFDAEPRSGAGRSYQGQLSS